MSLQKLTSTVMFRSTSPTPVNLGVMQAANVSGLGTTAIVNGVQNLSVTNLAKIKTTKVEFDPLSADYIVTLYTYLAR
jgi:hypothetical protein